MKKIFIVIIAFLMLISVSAGCNNNQNEKKTYASIYDGVNLEKKIDYIVRDGQTEYMIIIPEKAGEAINHAAEELSDFIQISTGVRLQVLTDKEFTLGENLKAISLGDTKLFRQAEIDISESQLNYDGFIIKTLGKSVFIAAANDRGLLYGCYDFLEKFLGIKFLSFDDTHIPKNNEVALYETDVISKPAFAMRTFLDGTVYGGTYTDPDFYVRARNNNHYMSVNSKYGGSANVYGRNHDHNFHCYVPREIYYESHPEFYYYSEQYDIGGDNGWTIDLQNGITEDGKLDESMDISVAKIVIEEMKKDIIAMPDIDFFIFEQEDGLFYYEYEAGSKEQKIVDKYGRSGIMIRFCNVIARELQKWADEELNGRKINIVTFAYSYTKYAPVKTENNKLVPIDETVVAADNLIIRAAFAGNRYYSYFDEEHNEETMTHLKGWQAITNNFMLWIYDADYVEYLWYVPFLNQIEENLNGFTKMNIYYMLNQGVWNSKTNWMSTMKAYLYSKLYWNPDFSVYELYNEYVNLYYEIAAPYIKEYMNIMDEHFARIDDNEEIMFNVTQPGGIRDSKYYDVNLMEKCMSVLEEAEEKVRKEVNDYEKREVLLQKIARVKVSPMRVIMKYYSYFYPLSNYKEQMDFVKKFFETCQYGGVDMMDELTSVESFKKNYGL